MNPGETGAPPFAPAPTARRAGRRGSTADRAGRRPLRILFVSGNPHLPQVVGGVEMNTHELVTELGGRGHDAVVVAKLSWRDRFGIIHGASAFVAGRRLTSDNRLGYTVFRGRRVWESIADLPRSDVAVIQNGSMLEFGRAFAAIGIPAVAYFHGVPFEDWHDLGGSVQVPLPFRGYMAVSQFVASRLQRVCGIDAVVMPPFFRRERYATRRTGQTVTFVNPVPVKGLHLALEIAALCPAIPFCFVCAWPLGLYGAANLRRRLCYLPNVVLRNRTFDMRTVYRDTKILLVPSPAETWGRVVSEAQFSGIPVVASDRGGLPESVGLGGIIVGYDCPPAVWAATIRELWYDTDLYRNLSRAALSHAARPALDPDRQIELLLSALARFGVAGETRGIRSAG